MKALVNEIVLLVFIYKVYSAPNLIGIMRVVKPSSVAAG